MAKLNVLSQLQDWGLSLGFSQIGVSGVDLSQAEPGLRAWLAQGFHGQMGYMAEHGLKRARPAELLPGTVSVVTARMNYLSPAAADWQPIEWQRLQAEAHGVVSLYARGRDYHKVLRARLRRLADRLQAHLGPLGHRVFTDSAPVMEVELAQRSGLGWRGKHTLLLDRSVGSMFFLGELFVDVALEPTEPTEAHCGSCTACIDVCPTQAIVAPYRLDARRCISYLTIEHADAIPLELRPLMGQRVYGCDDCQLVCPWNKYAQTSELGDFAPRAQWTEPDLIQWLGWTEVEFLKHSEGSPIRRIGHARWLRNVAVALGNAMRKSRNPAFVRSARAALASQSHPSELVREHVAWAQAQLPDDHKELATSS